MRRLSVLLLPIGLLLGMGAAMVPDPRASAAAGWWRPGVGTSFQIQFQGLPDFSIDARVYDLDLFDTPGATVASLHAAGRRAMCYINAGAWENWRPDKDQFPAAVIGRDYAGWPGEKWLDIRQIDVLAPIMRARFDQCAAKGFDGIDPDNMDGYLQDTGFPITADDQLLYNRWLANEAHARGLGIGLKNDPAQARALLPLFDWALTESCFAENWCGLVQPFVEAGKPVFAVEYTDTGMTLERFCGTAAAMSVSAILKNRSLDAFRAACPALVPGAPTNLLTSVSGTAVSFAWMAPGADGTPSGYQLQAATTAGGSPIAVLSTPASQTSLTVSAAPAGGYFIRIVALGVAGAGPPSEEVRIVIPGQCTAPRVVRNLRASVAGVFITLDWDLPAGGDAPTRYVLEAGFSRGASNAAVLEIAARGLAATASRGTYYVRVKAANSCGGGAATDDIAITIA